MRALELPLLRPIAVLAAVILIGLGTSTGAAETPKKAAADRKPQRLLLIGQGPDGHPYTTHEFMAGVNLLAKLLSHTPDLQTIVVKADEPWKEGPELIDGADGVLLFVAQGAAGYNSMRLARRPLNVWRRTAADCRPCIGPSARKILNTSTSTSSSSADVTAAPTGSTKSSARASNRFPADIPS